MTEATLIKPENPPVWGFYRLREARPLRQQFVGMDVLRAVASLMILLYHSHNIAQKHAAIDGRAMFATPNFWYACIELFFTMSGFLMVHMSYEMYGRPAAWKSFLIRRALRTPPLYYLYTLVVFAAFLIVPGIADFPATPLRLIQSLLFIPGEYLPIIAIGWTLNYEVLFYLLIGAALFLRFPYGPIATAAVIVVAVTIGQIFRPAAQPFHLWTDRILLDFVIGIVVALCYYDRVVIGKAMQWLLVALAAVLLAMPVDVDAGTLSRPLVFGVAAGLLVAVMTLRAAPPNFGPFEKPLVDFGSRAYTLYLCHILVLKLVEKVFFKLYNGTGALYIYIVVSSAAAIVASIILYRLVERPLTKKLQAWGKRHGSYSIR